MENQNLSTIIELLKIKPLKPNELISKTQIPRSTLSRTLSILMSDKLIKNIDGVYYYVRETPSIKDLYDVMYILHQQKSMDHKYRKLNIDKKIDELLISFINNNTLLKGKIDDYDFSKLTENITKASSMLKTSI